MGLIFNGNGDVIRAVDGSLTVEGLDIGGSTNIEAGIGTFSGNLTVGGVLTYEDVKNVDSVGIVTAREGVFIPDTKKLEVGNAAGSGDLKIHHTSGNTFIENGTGTLKIRGATIELSNPSAAQMLQANSTAAVNLYFNGNKKFETTNTGVTVTGQGVFSAAITASTYIQGTSSNGGLKFYSDSSASRGVTLNTDDHLIPSHDSNSDLGLTGTRWRNVYADTLYGDGSNLTGITGTTINNNANNRLITGSGTANTLEGEANLTYDGSTLAVTGDVTMTNTSSNPQLALISAANGIGEIQFGDANDAVRGNIIYRAGSAGDALCFNGYNNTERMRITSAGDVEIRVDGSGGGSSQQGILRFYRTNYSSGMKDSRIVFDTSSGGNNADNNTYCSVIAGTRTGSNNGSSDLRFFTCKNENSYAAAERVRIDESGDVLIGTTTSAGKLTVDSGTSNTCATFQSSDAGAGINVKDNHARSSIEQNGTTLKISSDTGAEYANSDIRFQVDSSTKAIILSNGRFGIGTNSPTAILHTYNSGSDGLQLQTSSYSSYVWQIQANDNLANGMIAGYLGLRGHSGIGFSPNAGTSTPVSINSSGLLKITTATSTTATEILRLENTHSDGKLTVLGFKTSGLGNPQTKIYGGNDNSGTGNQGGNSGAGKFKVTITNPSGTHQEVIYAENDASSKFLRLSTNGSERLRITSNGTLLSGTTNTDNLSAGGMKIQTASVGGNAVALSLRNPDQSGSTAVSLRFNMDRNSGGIHFNAAEIKAVKETTWTGSASTVDGSLELSTIQNENLNTRMKIASDGGIFFYGLLGNASSGSNVKLSNSDWELRYDTSSKLLKTNIVPLTKYGIDTVKKLKPCTFKPQEYELDGTITVTDETLIGFLADDMVEEVPEVVQLYQKHTLTKNPNDTEVVPAAISYDKLTVVLTKALQEAIAKIETLETKVAALESA